MAYGCVNRLKPRCLPAAWAGQPVTLPGGECAPIARAQQHRPERGRRARPS
jgi:hypothetical protein